MVSAVGLGLPTETAWRASSGFCVRERDGGICLTNTPMDRPAGAGCVPGRSRTFGSRHGKNYSLCWTREVCWTGKKPFWTPPSLPRKRGLGGRQNASWERYEVHGGGRRPGHTCRSATCVRATGRVPAGGEHARYGEGSAQRARASALSPATGDCRSRLRFRCPAGAVQTAWKRS